MSDFVRKFLVFCLLPSNGGNLTSGLARPYLRSLALDRLGDEALGCCSSLTSIAARLAKSILCFLLLTL